MTGNLRRRLRREDGIALVMALGIMFVLSITLASVLAFTSASSRDASRSGAGQTAYALAEAGLNNALAQLRQHYPNTTAASDPSWAPSSGGPQSYAGGTTTWSGTWSGTKWRLTSTGSVANPTGPGTSPLNRTIAADVDVFHQLGTAGTPTIWNYVYSGGTGNPCDMTIDQSTAFSSPLYIAGNLCLQGSATIAQPALAAGQQTMRLFVGGNMKLKQKANSAGTTSSPLIEAHVVGACQWWNKATVSPCKTDSPLLPTNVWAALFTNGAPANASDYQLPSFSFDSYYHDATLGPDRPCDPTLSSHSSSVSLPAFDPNYGAANSVNDRLGYVGDPLFTLTPQPAPSDPNPYYVCRNYTGAELAWHYQTQALEVNGTIYFDGSLAVDTNNKVAHYLGQANVFLDGSLLFRNGSALCAVLSGGSCDMDPTHWDTTSTMLVFLSNGNGPNGFVNSGDSIDIGQSSFQGGLYGTNEILVQNSSNVEGPMISPKVVSPGQSTVFAFPPSLKFQAGLPGDEKPVTYTIGPPQNVGY